MTDTEQGQISTHELVRRYLTTVVLIDDEATYDAPALTPTGEEAEVNTVAEAVAHSGLIEPPKLHRLDAADVAHAFGSVGIVCSILKPPPESDIEALAVAAVHRADVVILDWDLVVGETTGATATNILRGLIESAGDQPVRLVCIYTVDNPDGIAAGLAAELSGVELDPYTVDFGLTRVSVIGKELNTNCPDERMVPFDGLPAWVLTEFASVVDGLTSGFAVAALGAVRENSGWLLNRFHDGIDAGLLGHRMLIPYGDDVIEQMRDVIADEFRSILEADALVRASLDTERCLARSKQLRPDDAALKALSDTFHADPQGELDRLIADGVADEELAKKAKWATRTHAAGVSSGQSAASAGQSDLDFAELVYGRSHYSTAAPPLTLGVVVEKVDDGEGTQAAYYVCILPLCDSVRLFSARSFPFVRLRESFGKPFSFVVKERGYPIPLFAQVKLHELVFVKFEPDETAKAVVAASDGDHFIYHASDGAHYRFVARLRDVMAQRITHQIGSLASRVGATDLESQRFGWPAPAKVDVAPTETSP